MAALQTTVLHMKRPSQTNSFVILCVLCFQRQSFLTFIYYFCHCMSLHVCPGKSFILDSHSANFLERKCPFGFLLEVF